MTQRLPAEIEEDVRARIRYFRDLGVFDFYRRTSAPGESVIATEEVTETAGSGTIVAAVVTEAESPAIPAELPIQETASLKKTVTAKSVPADRAAALEAIRQDIGDCTRCPLHKGRHTVVFGDGDPNARLMFVGEGPGADEDAQGLPFVDEPDNYSTT